MLNIDDHSPIILKTVVDRIEEVKEVNKAGKKIKSFHPISASDFDGVLYQMVPSKTEPENLLVSARVTGYKELNADVTKKHLEKVFGEALLETPEDGFDVTLQVGCNNFLESSEEEINEFALKVSQLKYHIYFATFDHAFDQYLNKESFNTYKIPYRREEAIYISNVEGDSLQIIFSVKFLNGVDAALGKLAFQEIASQRKKAALGSAPGITYRHQEAPLELTKADVSVPEVDKAKDYGFMLMNLFDRNLKEERFASVINVMNFRAYMLYHMKCAKAFMHIKFRKRVDKLIHRLDDAKDLTGVTQIKRAATGRYLSSDMNSMRAQESQRY
mmetsp:Transcript_2688/g.3872  ORF Transcript_2688/g.3872 Transcript_2688/m.3872 type:complete len:330 (-) Transcript_2688:716-1705(-)